MTARRCAAKTRDGNPCGFPAQRGKRYCWNHDGSKKTASRRKRHHQKVARKRAPPKVTGELDVYSPLGLQQLLAETIDGVRRRPDKAKLAQARVVARLAHEQNALIQSDEIRRQLQAILEALHGRREPPVVARYDAEPDRAPAA